MITAIGSFLMGILTGYALTWVWCFGKADAWHAEVYRGLINDQRRTIDMQAVLLRPK